jgi:DNA-directed RNA polymerase specialized sigma24 family protein
MSTTEREEEALLVRRCLGNDQDAWSQLYHRYHRALLKEASRLVGRGGCRDTAEEVAARVWLSLARPGGRRLAAFDPSRGGFRLFLALRARQEWAGLCRAERSRPSGEAWSLSEADRPVPAEAVSGPEWQDFCATLSAQERRVVRLLRGEPDDGGEPLSDVNRRKLKQRVLAKLARFFADD